MCLSLPFMMSCYCLINPHFASLQQECWGSSLSPAPSLSFSPSLSVVAWEVHLHTYCLTPSDHPLRTHSYLYNSRNASTKVYFNVCIQCCARDCRGGGASKGLVMWGWGPSEGSLVRRLVTPVALPASLYLRRPLVHTGEPLCLFLPFGSSLRLRGKRNTGVGKTEDPQGRSKASLEGQTQPLYFVPTGTLFKRTESYERVLEFLSCFS